MVVEVFAHRAECEKTNLGIDIQDLGHASFLL